MARKAKPEEIVETDRLEGQPHPRETFTLVGQGDALRHIARAIRRGRPPHGLLISGPPGIGKATFAYRIARYMLRYGATDAGPEDLSVPARDPVSLQVAAGAHPGLLLLKRGFNDAGKLMTVLSVGEIRKLGDFFGMTSGAGGWRVAIIDTADDMNDAAANALLKALEEPPSRAMLLLLANAPGRLLPTIRSRCRRVDLKPLSDAEMEKELAARLPGMSADERATLVGLSGGSLGAALALAGGNGLALARDAQKLIDRAEHADVAAIMALADRLSRIQDGPARFGDFLLQSLTGRIRKRAMQGDAGLDRWTMLIEKLKGQFVRMEALYLDPRQTILSAARAMEQTARGRAL